MIILFELRDVWHMIVSFACNNSFCSRRNVLKFISDFLFFFYLNVKIEKKYEASRMNVLI